MSSQISDKKTTLIYFCCTKRTRLIVFTFNGIKDSPTTGDKQSTKKLRSATSLAVPMVSVVSVGGEGGRGVAPKTIYYIDPT